MSAFVLSKKHIDLMVKTAVEGPRDRDPQSMWNWGGFNMLSTLGYASANKFGQALVDENLKSIHYRYPDTVADPSGTPGPIKRYYEKRYKFKEYPFALTCVEMLKAIACYEYQTCEHDEWKDSQVYKACQTLTETVVSSLPGYDAAPWGI
jgi:hypothetical protein